MRLGFSVGRPRGNRPTASQMSGVPNPLRPTGAGDGSVCDHREYAERDSPAGQGCRSVRGNSERRFRGPPDTTLLLKASENTDTGSSDPNAACRTSLLISVARNRQDRGTINTGRPLLIYTPEYWRKAREVQLSGRDG